MISSLFQLRTHTDQGLVLRDQLTALEDTHAFIRAELLAEVSQRQQCEALRQQGEVTIDELTNELIQAKDARATLAAELALASEDSLYIEGRYGEQVAELTEQLADAKEDQQSLRSDLIEVGGWVGG